jgi:hypothetical protein
MGSIFEPLITSGKVDELADKPQIAGLKASLELPAKDYLKAMRMRRVIQEEVSKLFGAVDILIAPARSGIAPKVDQPLDGAASGAPPKDPGFRSIIQMGNLAGLPALVLAASQTICPSPCNSSASRSPRTPCSLWAATSSPIPIGTSGIPPSLVGDLAT